MNNNKRLCVFYSCVSSALQQFHWANARVYRSDSISFKFILAFLLDKTTKIIIFFGE